MSNVTLSPTPPQGSVLSPGVSPRPRGCPHIPRAGPQCVCHPPPSSFSLGISLPEGVDPSFLAALPDDIRREVLQNQLGIRPPARAPPTPSPAPPVVANPGLTEVSPEFLAALPPAIQEEVGGAWGVGLGRVWSVRGWG